MKRIVKILLLAVCLIVSQLAFAQTVSESTARSRANAFFAQQTPSASGPRRAPSKQEPLTLAYTSQGNGNTRFYVYNRGENDGYVIMGGDEQAKEILAYVPQGHFVYDSLPDNMKWWLGQYEQEIDTAIIRSSHAPKRTIQKAPSRSSGISTRQDIPDLITTKWGQGYPYNSAIPTTSPYEQYPTGCSATAVAQIMNYWKYPQSGIGTKTYTDWYGHELSANFAGTTYDWNNMVDTCTASSTQAQIDAISTLMYHVGVALNTDYDITGSSTYTMFSDDAFVEGLEAPALVEVFGYDTHALQVARKNYSLEEWETMIYDELLLERPVFYGANPDTLVGHAFILHGYDAATNMFSINWGWEGAGDGYYTLSGLNPNFQYYLDASCRQYMLLGIRPPGQVRNGVERGERFMFDGLMYQVVSPSQKWVEVSYFDTPPIGISSISIPSSVTYMGEEYIVERLGNYALKPAIYDSSYFVKYTEERLVTDVTPKHVSGLTINLRSIGYKALSNVSVDSLDLSSIVHLSPKAFDEAEIVQLIWPSAITTIPTDCFSNSRLKKITIPEGVVKIEDGTFRNCDSLENVHLPNSLEWIGCGAFDGCRSFTRMEIPASVSFVGMNVFAGCNKLFELYCYPAEPPYNGLMGGTADFYGIAPNFDEGILYVPQNSIPLYASADNWKDWQHIEAIETAPDTTHTGETFSVDGIEYMILLNRVVANGLTDNEIQDLYIPSQVEYQGNTYNVDGIADGAFAHKNLRSITISDGCRYIGYRSFSGCPLGGDVIIPGSVKEIRQEAFCDIYYAYGGACDLRHLTLSEGLREIHSGAFKYSKMNQLVIPSTVEKLGPAFHYSSIQTAVVRGGSISNSRGYDRPFQGCSNLKHLVLSEDFRLLPFTEIYLYEGSFQETDSLETVIFHYHPQTLDELTDRFYRFPFIHCDVSRCVLYVPQESLEIYQSASDWNAFADIRPIVQPTSLAITDSLKINVGQSISMSPIFSPDSTTVKYCDWKSSNPSIASVDQNGVVTALMRGRVTITATGIYNPELSDSCIVTITPEMYQITFLNDDGTILQQDSVEYGVIPTYTGATPTKPATAQYTYTFKGWDKEIVSVIGVETYTAQFDSVVNKYTITFVDEDGTILQTSEVEYGQVPAYNSATPSKQATAQYTYTFSGWTPEVVAVTGAATYTATYSSTLNSYLITFVNYDGTTLQSGNVNYGVTPAYTGTTPTKPVTAQYTYTFKGWDKEIVSVVEVETYTAQFDSVVNQYTITVIGENCTFTGDGTYDYGTEVTLTVTPNEGYLFVEWSDGVADAIRQIVVTEDATYTATIEEAGTGWQENSLSEQVQKIFDGTNYYILRGGKRYTMQGAEVK